MKSAVATIAVAASLVLTACSVPANDSDPEPELTSPQIIDRYVTATEGFEQPLYTMNTFGQGFLEELASPYSNKYANYDEETEAGRQAAGEETARIWRQVTTNGRTLSYAAKTGLALPDHPYSTDFNDAWDASMNELASIGQSLSEQRFSSAELERLATVTDQLQALTAQLD